MTIMSNDSVRKCYSHATFDKADANTLKYLWLLLRVPVVDCVQMYLSIFVHFALLI